MIPIEIALQQNIRTRRAARIGEQSDRVLPEAGYGAREIAALPPTGVMT
jgi:hypothetical protein